MLERVLVTGATGFIGRNVVQALLCAGWPVRALVRGTSAIAERPGVELHRGDITEPATLAGIEDGVSTVIHCAACLGKWGISEDALFAANARGGAYLLERFGGTPLHRFVHVSAGGVTGPIPSETLADESYPCTPATPYERSKYEGETAVLARGKALGVPVTVVRPTFTYGPGDRHKLALFRAIKRGIFAYIGDGTSVNHPVYIDDVVSALLLAAETGAPGQVYIIGGPRPVTKKELVETIAAAERVPAPRCHIPRALAGIAAMLLEATGRVLGKEPMLTRSRVSMMADNYGYSITKARTALGYAPAFDLAAGIGLTVDSYQKEGLL